MPLLDSLMRPFNQLYVAVMNCFSVQCVRIRNVCQGVYDKCKYDILQTIDPIRPPIEAVVNYVSERILTWIFFVMMFICWFIAALVFACFSFLVLYYFFVPVCHLEHPLYFDFEKENPTANFDFLSSQLSQGYSYDYIVEFVLPESPNNNHMGMFMTSISLVTDHNEVLANDTKPGIIHHKTPLLRYLTTLFWSLPLVLGISEEKQTLTIPVIEDWADLRISNEPYHAVVKISSQMIQIYSSKLKVVSRLYGLSYLFHDWFLTSAVVTIGIVFTIELWVSVGFVLFLFWLEHNYQPNSTRVTRVSTNFNNNPASLFAELPDSDSELGEDETSSDETSDDDRLVRNTKGKEIEMEEEKGEDVSGFKEKDKDHGAGVGSSSPQPTMKQAKKQKQASKTPLKDSGKGVGRFLELPFSDDSSD
eukprot:CAMPEP_0174265456 /NCGR_PEP_ID=MMETSP0439-20130205/26578_1 /TAXON_ID=0 /ORGANISM="Stereomyxa ramosa, Strain Chinc5" /LENGTH=418 /DNA_ID=CAMNT_0015351917 /DNA_START=42 /DNA_END=1295 /DNA_ORIENTATION=-